MEEAHVKRLICVTGFGAGDSRGHGGFLYNVAFHLLLRHVYAWTSPISRGHRTQPGRQLISRQFAFAPVALTKAAFILSSSPGSRFHSG
jgi:hypothetical protein